jgi:putative sterol carrier protein
LGDVAGDQGKRYRRKRPGQVVADRFARFMTRLGPERRARAMRGISGRILIRLIFAGMRRAFDRRKAKGVEAVLRWEIGGADDGGVEQWHVVIADERCRVRRRVDRDPIITLKLARITFLELATGIAAGPQLFMTGKLKIEGDMMQAANLVTFFRIPRAA